MNTTLGTEKLAIAVQTETHESFRQAYHEIADQHVVEVDVLKQLHANINQLEVLHARMPLHDGGSFVPLKKDLKLNFRSETFFRDEYR